MALRGAEASCLHINNVYVRKDGSVNDQKKKKMYHDLVYNFAQFIEQDNQTHLSAPLLAITT
jgi:hypothetical protein